MARCALERAGQIGTLGAWKGRVPGLQEWPGVDGLELLE